MENLQKLEEFLNLATANGGFRTSAQAMNVGLTFQAVVKDFQSMAAEIKKLAEEREQSKNAAKEPSSKKDK